MRQRILGSHKPPCHRHMVITTLSSMFCLAALQRKPDQCRMLPCFRHSRWLSNVLRLFGSARSHHPPTAPVSLKPLALWASLSLCFFLFTLPRGYIFLFALPRGFLFLFALPTGFPLSLSSLGLCLVLPPPSACPCYLGVPLFARLRAQQRVEEPYNVPCDRVCLPDTYTRGGGGT